jgi:hypothetical protein
MKLNKAMLVAILCAMTTGATFAKLPTPQLNDEQKAKAEDAKAKAAETAKKDGELLGKSQDRVADRYIKSQKAKGVTVTPTPITVAAAPPPAVKATAAPVPAATAKK